MWYNKLVDFIKKHKKAIIITSVILFILMVIIILMFTLFSLKEVELSFKTETLNITSTQQEEIKQKTLEHGGSVLFIGKEKIVSELESEFPYLKVVNIETKFPNKFVIHCAEREELFSIYSNNKYYSVDEELKILKISATKSDNIQLDFQDIVLDETTAPPTYKIVSLDLNLKNSKEGQFINLVQNEGGGSYFASKLQKIVTSIQTAFEQSNRDIAVIKSQFKNFELFYKAEKISESSLAWRICLRLIDNSNYEIQIVDCDRDLDKKISVMYEALTSASKNPNLLINSKLLIYENVNKQIVYQFIDN